jgi:hypothetical protein
VPWQPELFSGPALAQMWERRAERDKRQAERDRRRDEKLAAVPYFDGVMTGEIDALIGSFAGQPQLHDPVRGRVMGVPAFRRFVADTRTWLVDRDVRVETVNLIITPRRGVEELILHLDGDDGRIELPFALAADRDDDARIIELRMYFSSRPLTGAHAIRPPLLQPDPDAHEPDVVGEYQRALASGDVEAVVAAFEPDGCMREPAGNAHMHCGSDRLRALYASFFSNGGGIPLERCAVTDDGRSCALEYNVVAWGRTRLPPQAGIAVYGRGDSGKLAVARVYDDTDPPLAQNSR